MKRTLVFLTLVFALVMSVTLVPTAIPVHAQPNGNLLQNIPVDGLLEDDGTFEGVLSITELAFENDELSVSGALQFTNAAGELVTQTFTDISAILSGGGQGKCDILFLDLGPIFLDVLGLEVDLSQIVLDVDAVPGAGNLLGNLLCAVVGLLDNDGPLSRITRLLDRINQLL